MKILLGVDDSRFSQAAVQTVLKQASPERDEVRVVHVVDVLSNAYYPGIEHARDAERKIAETLVAETAKLLCSGQLQVTTVVEWGHPESKIIEAAAQWQADLIVLGSHGRTGVGRFLVGGVADAVMRHAHCSVELVRIPNQACSQG